MKGPLRSQLDEALHTPLWLNSLSHLTPSSLPWAEGEQNKSGAGKKQNIFRNFSLRVIKMTISETLSLIPAQLCLVWKRSSVWLLHYAALSCCSIKCCWRDPWWIVIYMQKAVSSIQLLIIVARLFTAWTPQNTGCWAEHHNILQGNLPYLLSVHPHTETHRQHIFLKKTKQ